MRLVSSGISAVAESKQPQRDVFLAFLHGNEVAASFSKSNMELVKYDQSGPCRLSRFAEVKCGSMGIPEGRNKACSEFLKTEVDENGNRCEWLFFLDSDMGFEPYILDMLLSVADKDDRPIVGGLAFAQREAMEDGMGGFRCFPRPTILDWQDTGKGYSQFIGRAHYPVNSLIRAGATGGAVLLIHRSVIEAIDAKYGPVWFDRVPDPGGGLMGEDISFFVRTKELDIPLHIHTGIRTTHFKHFWLAEEDFWQSFIPGPATEEIDVIVPVLHRPQNVEPLMQSLRASTGLATAWFVCEEGDDEEIAEVLRCGGKVLVSPEAHTFAEKVNVAYAMTSAPWLLLVGDDVRFRPGWFDQVADVHRRYGAQVIGTNDLINPRVVRGEHATHPAITRSYIDELGASWDGPGVVCHEGYRHMFVDDEIVTVAKQRGTFTAALGAQVEHLHPLNGITPMDAIYELGESSFEEDKKLFEQRAQRSLLVPA